MDTASSSSVSISPAQLSERIGRPGAPLLLDVRRRPRFDASDRLLAGARYCEPDALRQWASGHTPGEVVVYCVHGHEVSQQAARLLREAGWDARYLAGGAEGGEPGVDAPKSIAHWRATAPPTVRKRADLGVSGERSSRWITRQRPKIDRVACPWLIRRFIDPRAEFFYVPTEQVFSQAERLGAVPFDLPGAPISHAWERCSFDALLEAFALDTPALRTLATIVRAADTDRLGLAPQAAALLALSLGLSALHAQDDPAMLDAALPMYDALHAWCADAQGESHRWVVHAEGAPA